jgi:hypothetical protein
MIQQTPQTIRHMSHAQKSDVVVVFIVLLAAAVCCWLLAVFEHA